MEKLFSCGALFLDLLGFLGSYQDRLVELVWKALFQSLESSSVVPNVVYLEGAKLAYF